MTDQEFKGFVERHKARFANYARVMARHNELLAKDALSHAYESAWNKFGEESFAKKEQHMVGFVYKCTRNYLNHWFRDKRREASMEEMSMEPNDPDSGRGGLAIAYRLDEALSMLPKKQAEAVRVCYLLDPPLKPNEAAKRLGCSRATMFRRLFLARKALFRIFDEFGFGLSGVLG